MNRMVLAILACLGAGLLEARQPVSFDETVEAHAAGELEAARIAFRRMAEAGRVEAQFNLGAMLANGEGGPAQLVEAALWINLAAEAGFSLAEGASPTIQAALNEAQLAELERRLPTWRNEYSRSALLARHAPEFCKECEKGEQSASEAESYRIQALIDDKQLTVDREAPRYPRDAARSGAMGLVLLGGWINDAGDIEQPHVLFSDPEEVFDRAAMRAFSRWDFEWTDGAPESVPMYITQQISFTLDNRGAGSPYGSVTRQKLEADLEAASEDILAAYQAAWTLDFLKLQVDPENPGAIIEVTHQAARAGIVRAQLDLAERLRCGDDVVQDGRAHRFWLKQAAFEGVPRAQFLLSLKDSLDPDFATALRESAAESSFLPARLAEIRHQVGQQEDADRQALAALLESLPRTWRKYHGDDAVMRRAEALVEL